jgi:2OG-Fe(II) oxygenase superfamily
MGPVAAIRTLQLTAPADLTARYLAGADLELDVGAQLFLVRDGTGTDAVCIDGKVVATATGTRPAVVIGDALPDESGDDLVRLLAYMARPGRARMIAPEILRVPFWDAQQCATVIRESEAVNAWGSDPEDPVPGMEVSLATISPVLFEHVERHLDERVVPALREFWPEFSWAGVHDAFVIKYAAGSEATSLSLHHDVAQLSGSVRLNAGFEGGTLEFPRQEWSNADVPIGDLIVWPSLVTHPHRGAPVTRGVKYALTIWIALPG